jgi:hypothetical protein
MSTRFYPPKVERSEALDMLLGQNEIYFTAPYSVYVTVAVIPKFPIHHRQIALINLFNFLVTNQFTVIDFTQVGAEIKVSINLMKLDKTKVRQSSVDKTSLSRDIYLLIDIVVPIFHLTRSFVVP